MAGMGSEILLVELKPTFDVRDEKKLVDMMTTRRSDLDLALREFMSRGKIDFELDDTYQLVPALGFAASCNFEPLPGWIYFLIDDESHVSVRDYR